MCHDMSGNAKYRKKSSESTTSISVTQKLYNVFGAELGKLINMKIIIENVHWTT